MNRLLLLLLCAFPPVLCAATPVEELAAKLTAPNCVFGAAVEPDELPGRVVVVWNINTAVEQSKHEYSSEDGGGRRDRNNDRRNRQKDKDGEEILTPTEQLRKDCAALMKAAGKSKSLLIIGAVKLADTSEERDRQIKTIRGLRPNFTVYNLESDTALYDSLGTCRATVKNIADLIEGDRLPNTIAEAPEYVRGRIILFRTEVSETLSKRFVAGQNLEQMTARLRTTAQGNDARAEDARKMLEAIDAYIEGQCAAIESDLAATPSRAIARITRLCKTFPTRGRKYQGMLNTLRNSREIRLFLNVNTFLKAAANGDVGSGDMGRKADGFIKTLTPLTESKNQAVAAEAASLLTALAPYSAASLAAERNAARDRDREIKEAREAREKENRKNQRRSGSRNRSGEKEETVRNDTDAYSYLTALGPVGSFEVFKDELDSLDHSTCNYEALKVAYTKYENTTGEKADAAKNLIATIDARIAALKERITQAQKTPLSVLLTTDSDLTVGDAVIAFDYETLLTVNFPGFQNTPPGRNILKMYRDNEVKRIADAVLDYQADDEPGGWKEGETAAERKAKSIQTKIAKLKMLKKYRRTNSPLGKLCVAQLDQMGFSEEGIDSKIEAEEANLKAAKEEVKEEKKRQKENERSWR